MSDAGRKMDVEDVLSSIRRLVSEEARSAPEKRASQPPASPPPVSVEPEPATPAREKLVLTPAFRIPEEPVSDEPVLDSPVPQETPEPNVQEIHAATETPPAQPAPLTPVETADIPRDSVPEAPFTDNVEAFPPEAEETQTAPLDLSAIIPSLQELQEQAKKKMEPVPELAETADTAPPAESADAPASEMLHDPFETPPEPDQPAEPPLSAKTEPAVKDVAEPVSEPEPVAEHPAHSCDYDAIDFTAEKETYLDEEALRELVSEMVRSELQGELGDRITRNVRKLVRREIHRALASREFN